MVLSLGSFLFDMWIALFYPMRPFYDFSPFAGHWFHYALLLAQGSQL
jgi:hypothetical protein